MPTDLNQLQGTWSISSLEMDGQTLPPSMLAGARIVIKQNRFTSLGMGAEYSGTLEFDPAANPRQLDMHFDTGPEKGNVNLCIYELSGDNWKLCIATRGTVRPSAFATAPGTGFAFELLQRSAN